MENYGEVFNLMRKDDANKMCVDCKRPYPLFASINNAVFICEGCAEQHKELGVQVSFVRGLKEQWDDYLVTYMSRGGNSRFNKVLRENDIIEDADILYKYRTKAVENYRLLVRIHFKSS